MIFAALARVARAGLCVCGGGCMDVFVCFHSKYVGFID